MKIKKLLLTLIFSLFTVNTQDILNPINTETPKNNSTEPTSKDNLESTEIDKKTYNIDSLSSNFNKEKKAKKSLKKSKDEELNKFALNFENAALKNVLDYMTEFFDATFLPDDAITDEKKLKGVNDVKITFKTNKPFSEKQVWNFLDLILESAGLARIKMKGIAPNFYRITNIPSANKSNLPTFIGTDTNELPEYERIRYVYIILNKQAAQVRDIISKLISKSAQLEIFQELNALIVTDVGFNVKSMMEIVKALDTSDLPEVLSILNLKNADATEVQKLYEALKGKPEELFRPFGEQKKGLRLTQDVKVIAEPRRNTLILLGPKDMVQRIEKFITEHLDKTLKDQASRIHTHKLNYVPADQVANILNSVTKFGAESEAAKFGGIREGEKYLSRMYFSADMQSNSLIIKGEAEDYAVVKNIINYLDQKQPQVAVEVLIIAIDFEKNKSINSQIRNKDKFTVNAQTSGFFRQGIQVDKTNGSLITNLINLALAATPGSSLLTLGKVDVWAILGLLQNIQSTNIIGNPFLVITNKYTSTVSVGETRRISTATVQGGQDVSRTEQGDIEANLSVTITPQINSFGIINLDIDIKFDNFTQLANNDPNDLTQGNRDQRRIKTNANVADKEVLAVGGLIRTTVSTIQSSVPILGSIPLIGWLFKSRGNFVDKQNILIFITPRIIKPHNKPITAYTQNKANYAREMLYDMDLESNNSRRDPINRWFFKDSFADQRTQVLNEFISPTKDLLTKDKIVATNTNVANTSNFIQSCPKKPKSVLLDSVNKKETTNV